MAIPKKYSFPVAFAVALFPDFDEDELDIFQASLYIFVLTFEDVQVADEPL